MDHFDSTLLKTNIITSEIKRIAEIWKKNSTIIYYNDYKEKLQDLILIVKCIDLTTLSGDDTFVNVNKLCYRAKNPLCEKIIEKLLLFIKNNNCDDEYDDYFQRDDDDDKNDKIIITTGAVCVYPLRVNDCRKYFDSIDTIQSKKFSISIASVVAGFPCGQSPITVTLNDIDYAVKNGANEIDIVIDRSLVLDGEWEKLYNEIKIIAKHCHLLDVHLKVILSCGELGNLQNIYKTSMCAMMAGADFIKTSTGKESINATLTYGLIMIRAIYDFYLATNIRIGIKPAGGIKNTADALCWINLVRFYLGSEWLNNRLFRIGASSLLNNVEYEIFKTLFNREPNSNELSII